MQTRGKRNHKALMWFGLAVALVIFSIIIGKLFGNEDVGITVAVVSYLVVGLVLVRFLRNGLNARRAARLAARDELEPPLEHEQLDGASGSAARRIAGRIGYFLVFIVIISVGSLVITIPAERDYAIRAEVSGGISLAYSVRPALEEYFERHGEFPASNSEADLPPPREINSQYVSEVRVEQGGVVVVFGDQLHDKITGKSLMLVPHMSDEAEFSWTCMSSEIPDKWLIAGCRSTYQAGSDPPSGRDLVLME